MSQALIWVVDDEPDIREIMRDYLKHHDYQTEEFESGDAMLEALERGGKPDLVLLDVMMPGKDGFEVCQKLRATSQVPVLFLSARNDELDKILGLKLGADEYLVKPTSPREIVARVEAMLRRMSWSKSSEDTSNAAEGILCHSIFELDQQAMELRIEGKPLVLTRVEFRLVKMLMSQPGRVYPRETLVEGAYEDHRIVSDRTVDSHIKNIRSKIEKLVRGADPIQSIYGVGYKWLENKN
ncbi:MULTISPECIES: response regulator [Gammaproteobacteria]|uniref:response regulator n=1 Tax=Gammaproteobacteria TaxID=1236 RepID=UPI000DCF6BFE|nr:MULTISPECIES: response regulator [Gammaproteobacteria]RTE86538.1 response regulator [Aliidiomarina sp. B3213]TCZ90907.1 response regulator [Lysobacter sp. N42]